MGEPEDYHNQADFRLYSNHLQYMEMDNSIVECIPDSSMIDKILGDDSLILSAIKNDVEERCLEITRTWMSIVKCFFGTDEGKSVIEDSSSPPGSLRHDHQVLQEKMGKKLSMEVMRLLCFRSVIRRKFCI